MSLSLVLVLCYLPYRNFGSTFMNLSASSVMMAAFLYLNPHSAPGEQGISIPDPVAKLQNRYARMCSVMGGEPSAGPAFILAADYTGDGQTDFVVNTHAFSCAGADIAVCMGETCEVTVFAAPDQANGEFDVVMTEKADEEPFLNVIYNQGFDAIDDGDCRELGACIIASIEP